MKHLIPILLFIFIACGNKKKFIKSQAIEDYHLQAQLQTEISKNLTKLQDLNLQLRRIEKKDTSGTTFTATVLTLNKTQTARQDIQQKQKEKSDHNTYRQTTDSQKQKVKHSNLVRYIIFLILGIIITIIGYKYYPKIYSRIKNLIK